jgi:hypothetical protein
VLLPSYRTEEFKATITNLRNLTAVSIDKINVAVATAKFVSGSKNKTAQQYFEDLENKRLSDSKPVISTYNVFIIVLNLIAI